MISAFGVEHGLVSKALPDKVPDWASGAMPASTARAYNYSGDKKTKAAAHNFAWKTAGATAGTAAGAALVGLAFKKAKPLRYMPEFFYRNSKVKNPFTGGKTNITSGEKRRYLGMSLGGTVGTAGGATAGGVQLHRLKSDPQYRFEEPPKETKP
jgi:hypothetical protein